MYEIFFNVAEHVIFGDEILEAFGDVKNCRVSLHRFPEFAVAF